MKKAIYFIVLIVTLIVIGIFTFFFYFGVIKEDIRKILVTTNEYFLVDNYSIFGTHFNISCYIEKKLSNPILVLKNYKKEITLNTYYSIKDNKTYIYTDTNINDSIYLDDLNVGNYLLLVRDNNDYYTLKNDTQYGNLEYYTVTRNGKNKKIKIIVDKIDSKDYIEFKIKKSKLPQNVYDIALDPGHGGKDTGAIGNLDDKEYNESDLTLSVSLLLKKELEKLGLKVKMTRESDVTLSNYKDIGRAVIPNEFNAKYSISLHFNSTNGNQSFGGVEVYTPNNIGLSLAKLFSDNISTIVGYSSKKTDRLIDGVYYSGFTEQSIEDYNSTLSVPYDIKVNSSDMYMIREVGGIHTFAYVDGRNTKYGKNKYYDSNKTAEPYLIEMGYINYQPDLEKVLHNPELFAIAISNSISNYLNIS